MMRFRCVECGRLTAGRRPKGGDGTLMYPRRHNGSDGKPCPGNRLEAEWVSEGEGEPGAALVPEVRKVESVGELQPVIQTARALPPVLAGFETSQVQLQVSDFYEGIPEIFESWVKRCSSPETRRAYRLDVMTFAEWMGWAWPKDAEQFLTVSVGQVQGYRDWLEATYRPKTTIRRLCSLSSWYKYLSSAAAELRLPINVPNPAHSQFIPRGTADPESPAPALGIGMVRQLLSLPGTEDVLGLRDRAILTTFFFSGARIGSVAALEVGDIHQDEENGAEMRLREKGNRIRSIGLHAAAAAAIREYLAVSGLTDGPLFRPSRGPHSQELAERGLTSRGLRYLLQRYLEQLPNGDRLRPHSARATVATELLDAGTDVVKVQQLLGHRDIRTTLAYDRRRSETRDSASHALPY